jgi:AsmA protein
MKRLLKILGILILVLVAAVLLVGLLVDAEDYRGDIETGFSAATGRELDIAGDLRLCLLPRPVLEMTEVTVPGASGSKGPALVELDRARLYPRLLPLLSGRLELVAFSMTGSIRFDEGGDSYRFAAEGDLSADDAKQGLQLHQVTLTLKGLNLGKGLAADLTLRAGVEADLDAHRYVADEAVLDIHAFGESLAGESLLSAPVFTGDLVVDELDPRVWLEQMGLPVPATKSSETFRRFSLETRWRLEHARLNLHDLVLSLDETRFSGDVEPAATSPRGYRFDLLADRLDLDPYLPLSGEKQEASGKAVQQPATAGQPVASKVESAEPTLARVDVEPGVPATAPLLPRFLFPLGVIGDQELAGRLRIDDLRLGRLSFGEAEMEIRSKGCHLDIDTRAPRFYSGHLVGRLGVDLSGNEPVVSLSQRADEIQTGSLLADLVGEDRLTGRGTITADLTATGRSSETLRQSLRGNLAIHIPQGAVEGFNLERLVREAEARWRGRSPPKDLPMQTDFKDFQASAELAGGVLHNRDLTASTDHLRITGAGTVDLFKERFDYRFQPVFVNPQGLGIKELEGVPIPVRLTGFFAHPHWAVDLGSVLKSAAKRQLDEQGGDLLQKLEERTGIKGLGRGLKNLFGN